MIATYGTAPGEGERGRAREPWLLRVAEAAGPRSRGSFEWPHGPRVSVLPGAVSLALVRGVLESREAH